MHGSNWYQRYSLIALAVIVALLASSVIWIIAFDFGRYAPYRQDQSTSQSKADNTEKEARNLCIRERSISSAIECVYKEYKKHETNTRERRDLYAQEGMEQATFWIFIFSVVTTVATALGVFLLWKDIAATRQIGMAQTRAYLAVEVLHFEYLDGAHPSARMEIRNSGQTPARNIVVGGALKIIPYPTPFSNLRIKPRDMPTKGTGIVPAQGTQHFDLNYSGETGDTATKLALAPYTMRFFVIGSVGYTDVYGRSWETEFCSFFDPNKIRDVDDVSGGWELTIYHNEAT